ncbi:MAG: hypothetical protein K6E94_00605 [Elusimicrobiaceae bacterium]|nr:hypothetical protein [Elusimicrobiaceae bacterium]
MYVRRYKTVHRDEISIYADIIATESNVPIEKITKALEDWFAEAVEDEVTVGYIVELEELDMPFSVDDLREYANKLTGYRIDDIHKQNMEYCRESWHTHHKEGKPCKAKIKPIYWHRIRSFCVQNNYH